MGPRMVLTPVEKLPPQTRGLTVFLSASWAVGSVHYLSLRIEQRKRPVVIAFQKPMSRSKSSGQCEERRKLTAENASRRGSAGR